MQLILASNSPRRKKILSEAGYEFSVIKSDFDEVTFLGEPAQTAEANAQGKAKSVFDSLPDKNAVVIGADTIVVFGGKIIGKPTDERDAYNTLKMLSGKTHTVITGFCIACKDFTLVDNDVSYVTFNDLSDKLIKDYIASGCPMDKAGSYGIWDDFPIVKEYKGSLLNIVGLPLEKVKPIIDKNLK